jgi:ribulose kinase
MLAAVGAGKYGSVVEAAVQMSTPGGRYVPQRETRTFHEMKYKVFGEMYGDFKKYQAMMGKR